MEDKYLFHSQKNMSTLPRNNQVIMNTTMNSKSLNHEIGRGGVPRAASKTLWKAFSMHELNFRGSMKPFSVPTAIRIFPM